MSLPVAVATPLVVEGRTTPLGATLGLCTVDIGRGGKKSCDISMGREERGMEVRTMHMGEPSSRVVRQSHPSSTCPYVHKNLRFGRTVEVRYRGIEVAK